MYAFLFTGRLLLIFIKILLSGPPTLIHTLHSESHFLSTLTIAPSP